MRSCAARRCLAACLTAATLAPTARAQETERQPALVTVQSLENFRLAGAPALALLGIASASVKRPDTPRDLIASLVSGAGSDGIVPDGYALETAPFWLFRHRALELKEYHAASLADRLRYFTAISVATSRKDSTSGAAAPDAHVAVAIRTLLVNGRASPALLAAGESMREQQLAYIERYRRWEAAHAAAAGLDARRERLARQENLLSTLVTRVLVGQEGSLRDSAMRTLARRDSLRAAVAAGEAAARDEARLGEELDRIETRLSSLAERFSDEEVEPDGFILELAVGTRATFERGNWDQQRSDGIGVWLTPMYRIGASGLELIGVARYLSNVIEYEGDDLLDLGARIGLDVGKGSVAAEHVWRRTSNRDRTRWAALFDYPLGGRVWAVASFGSDYRQPAGKRPVIATIGLNLGFGAIEILPSRR